MTSHVQTIREWYRRVWENGDTEAISELTVPDVAIYGLEEMALLSAEDIVRFREMIFSCVRDIKVTVLQAIEQDDWISVLVRLDGWSLEKDCSVTVSSMSMARMQDNRIAEGYNFVDFFSLFEQLGSLPPRALDMCLLGRALTIQD